MDINYIHEITESPKELLRRKGRCKDARIYKRLQMLYLLKTEKVKSLRQVCQLIGLSHKQAWRHWKTYKQEGIEALLSTGYTQRKRKLDSSGQKLLIEYAKKGHFSTLWQVKDWLMDELKIEYTEQGIWYLLKALKVKLKKKRPKHPTIAQTKAAERSEHKQIS